MFGSLDELVAEHGDLIRPHLFRAVDRNQDKFAALHAAAGRGDREMVDLLLKHHADPNAFVNASGNAVYAAKTPEIRKLLEAHGGFLDPYDLVWKGEDDEVMRIVTERPETALAGCGGVFTAVVTCGRRALVSARAARHAARVAEARWP